MKDFQKEFPNKLHIITRAKKNYVAYKKPKPYKEIGRKPLREDTVPLQDLFVSEAASFQKAILTIYGQEKKFAFFPKFI